jgi:arginine/lysine/ornithine decarboxylase
VGEIGMALETLKGVAEIGGFEVLSERPKDEKGNVDWDLFDEQRKDKPIYIDHDVNMISFRIQDGPIKENGVNGCQVDTLIHAAMIMIQKLDKKFPCWENKSAYYALCNALGRLEERKTNRKARGVEGYNKI